MTIDSNEIGITVENVLERTVVHLVKEGSAAQLLGVVAGSLLLAVHDTPTHTLSHFETVDALKRAPRPARLRFRPLPPDLLVAMRDRMHSLVVQTSAHSALAPFLSQVPSAAAPPPPSEAPPSDRIRASMRFRPPPQEPHNDAAGDSQPSALAHASAAVCEWACDQLQFMLFLYASGLATVDGSSASAESGQRQQLRAVTDILDSFHEALRRPLRARSSFQQSGPSHSSRVAALSELMNLLVFGLAPQKASGNTDEAGGSQLEPTRHRLVDWCSPLLRPLLTSLMDVACALLEADCDLVLMYPAIGITRGDLALGGPRSDGGQWIYFDATIEPVLSDGAAAAFLVVLLRAFGLTRDDATVVSIATPLTASLASARCAGIAHQLHTAKLLHPSRSVNKYSYILSQLFFFFSHKLTTMN